MNDARSLPASSQIPAPPARVLIGPLLAADRPLLRYGAAIAVVLLIAGVRAAVAPLLGTQAPLLPFVLGVFVCAYLGGRGPALLASGITPILATLWFTNWPHDAPALQWIAHVAFFLLLAVLATVMMHELQSSARAQQCALDAAAEHARDAQQSAERMRIADRRKDEFLAMLAHELRNPLAPIRNVSHILASGELEDEVVRRSSALLQRQVNQLTRLVDDLLDVARITRGAVVLRHEVVDLAEVTRTALESVQPMIDARDQVVSIEVPAEPVQVDGDPVRLCQVVSNLLSNAAKYSPERARIFLSVQVHAEQAEVVVRDEGIGLDAQMLPRVFDLFEQGDRSLDRSQGGLGIGLTIVKRLVEMHGGSVEAHSAGLNHGAEFRIRLPWARAAQATPAAADSPASQPARQRQILIVDDNVDAADSMCWLLRGEGHVVEVVYEGASALSKLEEFRAELVLLDIGLPRMDGYMVAHAIRARFPQPPRLVALTGYGRDDDRRVAQAAGFDGHLTKPVDPPQLLRIIENSGAASVQSRTIG